MCFMDSLAKVLLVKKKKTLLPFCTKLLGRTRWGPFISKNIYLERFLLLEIFYLNCDLTPLVNRHDSIMDLFFCANGIHPGKLGSC